MSARFVDWNTMAALGAIVFVVSAPCLAQTAQDGRLPTLADCPKGYVLGIEDLADPMPMTRIDNPKDFTVEGQKKLDADLAAQAQAAPRRFVTGCVPPPTRQQ